MKRKQPQRRAKTAVRFLAMLALGLSILVPASNAQTQVTYRPPGPEMLIGYLSATGSQKSISWDKPASNTDESVAAGDLGGPALQFVSEPLPRMVAINVSRDLELDVNVQSTPNYKPQYGMDSCHGNFQASPMLDVQVMIDGRRFAGIGPANLGIDYEGNPRKGVRPQDPAGFTTCRYRMHSEADVLLAGSRITITLRVTQGSDPVVYGLGSEHPSVLRIPYYAPEEWALRNPSSHVGQSARSSFQPQPGGEGAAAAIVLGAFVLAGRRTDRKHGLSLVLLLSSSVLAGCTSTPLGGDLGADGGRGGSAEASFVPDDSILTSNGTGSIVGFVHDDLFGPLIGVHVSGRGLANFDDTDRHGRFTFAQIVPGVYRMRFELPDYRTYETDAEVRAGFINRLDVTMILSANVTGEQRKHPHDYWSGQTSREVLNETTLGMSCYNYAFGLALQLCQANAVFYSAPGLATTILPGTYDVEVRIFGDPNRDDPASVTLAVNANNEGGPTNWGIPAGYNWTLLYPRPIGEPFHVRMNWEMTDVGHQPFSTVQFAIMGHGFPERPMAQQLQEWPGFPYEYGASIVVHKGVVPLEPRHPDHWRGNNTVPILAGAPWDAAPSYPGVGVGGASNEWVPTTIVPPGTQWLEVFANRSRAARVAYAWDLEYTDGTIPLTYAYPEGYAGAPASTDVGLSHRWRIPVAEGHEDFFYSKHSAFRFRISPADDHLFAADVLGQDYYGGDLEMTLDVIAHKDPMPT